METMHISCAVLES